MSDYITASDYYDDNGKMIYEKVSDYISRQAAIDEAKEWIDAVYFEENDKRERKAIECFIGSLKNMPSAQPEQRWIPCSEGLPEDLEEVNVTWVNHDPEPYYDFVKDKPFTATAVYYKEKWYWYSSTCADILAEYGRNPNEEIDDGIEIIAWMPLPEPWKEKPNEIH